MAAPVLNLVPSSVLTKGTSAEVQIALRTTTLSGPATVRPIPLETFAANKDMGRILIRRGGETIGAGESFLDSFFSFQCRRIFGPGIILAIDG